MTKIEAIRANLKLLRDCGFFGPEEEIVEEAMNAIEAASAFINSKTVYFGEQSDVQLLRVAREALEAFYKDVPKLITEPAEPTPEPKRVHLPVVKDNQ